MRATIRLLALVAALITGAVLARQAGIPSCEELRQSLERYGTWAPLLFIGMYALATVLFIPGTIPTFAAGVFFGPLWGTLWVVIGSVSGACLAFAISRYVARDWVESLFKEKSWYRKLTEEVERHSFRYLLFLRLSPIFPFNGLNYACGLLHITFRDYFLSSLIGMFPATVAYVYVSSTAGCYRSGMNWELLAALMSLALLSLLPVIFRRLKK